MKDYTTLRSTLESFIQSNFTTVPIVFENVESDTLNTEHIEIVDHQTDSESLGMGEANLTTGIIVIQIFTETGVGTSRARAIAVELEALLSGDVSGITLAEPELTSVGQVKGMHLYQHNLSISYTYVYG